MGNPIKYFGTESESWLRRQNARARAKMYKKYGGEMMADLDPRSQPKAIEDRRRAFENAFNHVHGAALVRSLLSVDEAARFVGFMKEENQWPQDKLTEGGRRDTYGDLWNDEIGIALGGLPAGSDLAELSMEMVRNGQAMVRKFSDSPYPDPDADPNKPHTFRGDVRLQGVEAMTFEEMKRHAPKAARNYWKAWNRARSTPYPPPAELPPVQHLMLEE